MGLRDWIIDSERVATVTVATSATHETKNKQTVATVATVTVASSEKTEKPTKPKLDPSVIPDDSPNPSPPVRSIPPTGDNSPRTDTRRLTPKRAETIPPAAKEWLQDHRQELKAAGWSMRELYRANRSRGIAWVAIWDKHFLKVYLHDNGVIFFEFIDSGRDCQQTARPMPQRPTRAQKGVGHPIILQ